MKGLKLTIKFTEEELNAIVDAAEKIDGWVNIKPLETAVGKIVDSLNGLVYKLSTVKLDKLSEIEINATPDDFNRVSIACDEGGNRVILTPNIKIKSEGIQVNIPFDSYDLSKISVTNSAGDKIDKVIITGNGGYFHQKP